MDNSWIRPLRVCSRALRREVAITSYTDTSVEYAVVYDPIGGEISCSCPAFYYHVSKNDENEPWCKHLIQVAADSCNWQERLHEAAQGALCPRCGWPTIPQEGEPIDSEQREIDAANDTAASGLLDGGQPPATAGGTEGAGQQSAEPGVELPEVADPAAADPVGVGAADAAGASDGVQDTRTYRGHTVRRADDGGWIVVEHDARDQFHARSSDAEKEVRQSIYDGRFCNVCMADGAWSLGTTRAMRGLRMGRH